MCGVAGAFDQDRFRAEAMVVAMNARMHARGPDDEGVWSAPARSDNWLALGSRRLAIIDTSRLGHQPMVDEETGVAIVYNGMTYNFKSLRSTLESDGASFRSMSDTEVVLRLYIQRGKDSIAALDGMFGVAIWDPRSQSLLVARDRLGIKPLYFTRSGGRLVFASQVRAILASGAIPMRPNVAGIQDYLATGAAVDPTTVVEGIEAVRPGETLTVRDGQIEHSEFWRPSWSVRDVPWHRAVEGFRERLDASVRSHLISDVPTSVFLSGGLDSSVIAGLAARHSPSIHSMSVVFAEDAFNEAAFSRLVARRAGTQHHEVTLASSDLTTMLPGIFAAMDQPTFDGVNTYVVAVAAREAGLKVSLSGLGADELLDGYGLVRRARVLSLAGRIPRPVRGLLPAWRMNPMDSRQDKLRAWMAQPGDINQAHTLLRALFLPEEVTRLLSASTVPSGAARVGLYEDPRWACDLAFLEMSTYMRNVLLRDTDCMCMANSVELRVPYLDNGIVDFVLSLPMAVRSRRKRLIVDAFRDLLPPEVIGRRKQGFGLPIGLWMASALQDVVAARLSEPPEALRPLFDWESVQDVWGAFQVTGRRWLRPWSLFALFTWWASVEAETPPSPRPS
jgi:asparagine synthase (glutamine-hydrolysing)